MKVQTKYRVHKHYKFEHGGRKYAADLESDAIVEINDVEWELLNRDLMETIYATVENLKSQFKTEQIFDGIERLERLSQRRHLLSPIADVLIPEEIGNPETKLKLLVPFQFALEKDTLDTVTNENRYHLLKALSKYTEVETIDVTGDEAPDILDFVSVQTIKKVEKNERSFPLPWYVGKGYDGILLLSQVLWFDTLCYPQEVPILYCAESDRRLQDLVLDKTLEHATAQKPTDLILPKASWLTNWLSEFGVNPAGMSTISEGINVVEPIGKALAKQYTASLTENPLFSQQPVVGIISGFEPNTAVRVISELATSNPHIAFFVYDSILVEHYNNTPGNVVLFSADDEDTRSVLPVFFQALDLVCFPAVPGTSPSLVLEAMAYGTPAIVISQYGLPPEIEEAGVLVQCSACIRDALNIPIQQLSKAMNQLLKDTKRREKYEQIARSFAAKYTWDRTAMEIVQLFKQSAARAKTRPQPTIPNLFPPIFCQYYDPRTGSTYPRAYNQETKRFDSLENTLAVVLSKHHTPAEVASVFKHFQRDSFLAGNGLNCKV
ncbi:MAG: glycosyltransferase [Candidatus Poribacteria bacterium]|nr:glycosyltransferase [Candidatus Poribacteria bacterium]